MTFQSSSSSYLRSTPNTEKRLPSRPTDFVLVEPDEGVCIREDKQANACCLPGPNQVILQSWNEETPLVMLADYPPLYKKPFTCFNCDDFIVFVSKSNILMARLRMESIFNGDIEEAKQLGYIAKNCLDWNGPVECFILTPELAGGKSPDIDKFMSHPRSPTDSENHYISYIKRWGSRFRQRELERFFWSKWDMAKRIDLTVVAYQPFYDPTVSQSSYVIVTNGKARQMLDMEKVGSDTAHGIYVSRQHNQEGIPRRVTTKLGEYGPWKEMVIRSTHFGISLFSIGFRGKQRNEGFSEYWKPYPRKFRMVYNS